MRNDGDGAQRLRHVRIYESIAPLVESPRFGAVLWQLPESFQRDDDRLAATLERIPRGRHCFEFRHASWFADDVYAILRGHAQVLAAAASASVGASRIARLAVALTANSSMNADSPTTVFVGPIDSRRTPAASDPSGIAP